MSRLIGAVKGFLNREEWRFEVKDDHTLLTGFNGKNGQFRGTITADKQDRLLLFYFNCPYNVPESKHMEMADFLCRANYGMIVNTFEIDLRDGEVRIKAVLVDAEGVPDDETLRTVMRVTVTVMDRYFAGINGIVYGGLSAVSAIDLCEGNQQN